MGGITAEPFMKKIGVSLDKVASAILTALDGGVPPEINAIGSDPSRHRTTHMSKSLPSSTSGKTKGAGG
jgi:hypothetical protein